MRAALTEQRNAELSETQKRERKRRRHKEEKRRNSTKDAFAKLNLLEAKFVLELVKHPERSRKDAIRRCLPEIEEDRTIAKLADSLWRRPVVRAAHEAYVLDAMNIAGMEVGHVLKELAKVALLPDVMLEGKPTYRDKLDALRQLTALAHLLPGNVVDGQRTSITDLIVQAGRRGITHDADQNTAGSQTGIPSEAGAGSLDGGGAPEAAAVEG
jgi:hypothetical protein